MALIVPNRLKSLERTYYDPTHEASYAGARNLLAAYKQKIKKNEIVNWLAGQDAYTLHKPARKKFPRLHYDVTNIDDVWEADLVDLKSLKTYNDNYVYLLVVIDVLSKYVWVEPLRDKTGIEVTRAFDNILARGQGRIPICLQSDKGKEFIADTFQKFLSKKGIKFRTARNPDVKAAIVERVNRTLKERMWRYFTYKKTHRYIDVLQQFVQAYNHARHTSIGMAPDSVNLRNASLARANIERRFHKSPSSRLPKYKGGTYVRISKAKGTFAKGYKANWSEEIFEILRVKHHRQSIPVYILRDLAGEEIDGFFYEEELTLVKKDIAKDEFEIESVLRTKGKGRTKQLFVSWRGYPEKFNSWIPAANLKNIAK